MKRKLATGDGITSILQDLNIYINFTRLEKDDYGLVRKYGNGYLIFIEETLCFDMIVEVVQHEILHIILGHLDDDIKTEQQKETEVAEVLSEIKKENENDLFKMR